MYKLVLQIKELDRNKVISEIFTNQKFIELPNNAFDFGRPHCNFKSTEPNCLSIYFNENHLFIESAELINYLDKKNGEFVLKNEISQNTISQLFFDMDNDSEFFYLDQNSNKYYSYLDKDSIRRNSDNLFSFAKKN